MPRTKGKTNINIDAAMIHVLGDMLQSIGVTIAATIIYFYPAAWIADPVCTFLFSILVMCTTFPVVKKCILIVMEGAPVNFDMVALTKDIWDLNTEGHEDIIDVHDLHVWAISVGKNALTVHIKSHRPLKTLSEITELCRKKYKLYHTVI